MKLPAFDKVGEKLINRFFRSVAEAVECELLPRKE